MHEIITHAHKVLTKGAHGKSVSDLSLRCKVARPTLSQIREKYTPLSFVFLYRYAFIFLRFYVPFVDSFIGSNFVISL